MAGFDYSSSASMVAGFPYTVPPSQMAGAQTIVVADRRYYMRCYEGGTITKVGMHVDTPSGNISVAVYRNTGSGRDAAPGALVQSSGSVACPAAGYAEVALGATVTVAAGDWLSLAMDNTTAKVWSGTHTIAGSSLPKGFLAKEDAAFTAPATATPATEAGPVFILVGVAQAAAVAGRHNITIRTNEDWTETFTWKDSSGVAVNLTGYTAKAQVREQPGSTVILTASTAGGTITLGGAAGTISINVPRSTVDDSTAKSCVWDLVLTSGAGAERVLLEGTATIVAGVTTAA